MAEGTPGSTGRATYAVSWASLQDDVEVPREDQVVGVPAHAPVPVVPPEELDRQKALGIVGDFRLER